MAKLNNKEIMGLKEIYKKAAIKANTDGIDAGNEDALVSWIRQNCKYDPENEFFLALGIGCELADIQAQAQGFDNEVHRAFEAALDIGDNREKHLGWLKYN